MRGKTISTMAVLAFFIGIAMLPAAATAATQPTLHQPPANLPAETYYTPSGNHYTVSSGDWGVFFKSIIDNQSIVKYNWSKNATQDLIVFDLSYSGMNYYGGQFLSALGNYGSPTLANMTKAFWDVANQTSQVSGYTNIHALNTGAFPGFSWSTPKIHSTAYTYYYLGIIVALIGATFVLYYVFNRKK